MKRSIFLFVYSFSLTVLPSAAFSIQSHYQLGIGLEDNVARAVYSRDFHSDWVSDASINISDDWALNKDTQISLSANLASAQYFNVRDLSWYQGKLKTEFGWQPGFGYLAPWYQFSLAAGYQIFGDDHRNHWFVQGASQASKRITDRIMVNTGISYQYGEADNTVFDRNNVRWFLNSDYSLFNSTALYATYSLDYGYVWTAINLPAEPSSSAADVRGHHLASETAETISPYGDVYMHDYALTGVIEGDWYAYRANALNQSYNLGINQKLTDNFSLDLSYQYRTITNEADKTYKNQSVYLSLLGRI